MLRTRTAVGAALLTMAAAAPLVAGQSQAAAPAAGTISATSPSVSWEGGPFLVSRPTPAELGCAGPSDPTCDHFALTIDGPDDDGFTVLIEVAPRNQVDDVDIHVFDPDGTRIAVGQSYEQETGSVERVVLADPPDGTYTVSVNPYAVFGSDLFDGSAAFGGAGNGTGFSPLLVGNDGLRIDNLTADCLEAVPVALGMPGATDPGDDVALDVHFLLDGISVERALAVIDKAQESYGELEVTVNPVALEPVSFPGRGIVADSGGGSRDSTTIDDLFEQTKAHMGGVRPAGADLVFTLTAKEIGEDTDGNGSVDDIGVAGVADCIGGVRFDDNAFGIGEAWADTLDGIPAEQQYASSIILAHEIGHLMGAHHHYGECATARRPHISNERFDPRQPCTVMFPYIGPLNFPFSTLSSAVVRGHAVGYAHE